MTPGLYLEELSLAALGEGVVDVLKVVPLHLDEHQVLRRQRTNASIQQVVFGVKLEEVGLHRRLSNTLVNLECCIVTVDRIEHTLLALTLNNMISRGGKTHRSSWAENCATLSIMLFADEDWFSPVK